MVSTQRAGKPNPYVYITEFERQISSGYTIVGGNSDSRLLTRNYNLDSPLEMVLDIETFRETLRTKIVGNPHIEFHQQVSSTNDVAITRGKTKGAIEGTLIIAEHQTAGRGRYGRKWSAPHGKCILASVIFRHRLKHEQVHLPNLIGALSIAQGIHAITGLDARIKHPNDVRIAKRKVAGVLTEIEYDRHRQPFFVLGIGINVNVTSEEFPSELKNTATSLQIASSDIGNSEICRIALLQSVLQKLEENYIILKAGNLSVIEQKVTDWVEKS